MIWVVLFVVFLACIFLPQWWTRHILKKHSKHRSDFPGSGGEFAKHLIKKLKLDTKLETTDGGDHYDPQAKTVRLLSENMNGRSLTAVVVAAHEVGHAIQHKEKMPLFLMRTPLAKFAFWIEKTAQLALIATPVFLSFIPAVAKVSIIVAVVGMLASTLVHVVTLPVEFNASFSKALPILKQGNYLNERDFKSAKRILLACALTYVSAALASLLNIWRWLRFMRR
jgi:Zn-dependent membrane protease YugP